KEGFPSPLMRVLVVDDCRDTTDSMALLLRLWGHDVRVAHNGPEALAVAVAYGPDVVLLDLGLPGIDGFEVARRLRQRTDLAQPLIVSLSGFARESAHQRAHESGCDHCLNKPADPLALRSLLARGATRPGPYPSDGPAAPGKPSPHSQGGNGDGP